MQFWYIIPAIIFFLFIILIILIKLTAHSTPSLRKSAAKRKDAGKTGEIIVANILQECCTQPGDYVINDIIFFNPHTGYSSQIDHILIGSYGVFVIETKNYSGEIYGNDSLRLWKLYRSNDAIEISSPVKQNGTHVHFVRQILHNKVPVYGFVVFVQGNTEHIQSNYVCTCRELRERVTSSPRNAWKLSVRQKERILKILIEYRDKYPTSANDHLLHINKMRSDIAANICPRCGSKLVLRHGKYGSFFGCSKFPKCKFKKNITE